MVSRKLLARLAFCATFFALGVICLGAFTRLIDAGLGCPDWPGCYGHLILPAADKIQATSFVNYKAWAEMIHRYFVAGLSVLIIILAALTFINRNLRTRANLLLVLGLILLLGYQIMLGQWTVTLKLLPIIVTQHLLGGFFILSLLWLIYLNNRPVISLPYNARYLLKWAWLGLIILVLQITLGAWTSTHYASLSCPDFPFCQNDVSNSYHFKQAFDLISPIGINYEGGVLSTTVRQTIQMTHRFGALVLTMYLFLFFFFYRKLIHDNKILFKSMHIILGLLVLQLCFGITNVMFQLPLATALAHNLVAALLLLAMLTFIFKLTRSWNGSN